MNMHKSVERDERTVAVENASYKWAYGFVAFALLVDGAYRGVVRNEAAWDLLALAIVPGIVCAMYHARQKILGKRYVRDVVLIACLGGVVGLITIAILKMIRGM
jgi:hypothetical protein